MSKALEILKFFLDIGAWERFCLSLPSENKIKEAIAELEAMEARIKEIKTPKTCGGCYWRGDNYCDHICGICLRNDEIRDMHEPKDNV